jgi:hypothetical protein
VGIVQLKIFFGLQELQQLRLCRQRQLCNFVQK